MDALPAESTILLEPGTYLLTEPLDVGKPLRLVGAGMDETEVVYEAEGYTVRFSGDGPFIVEDITFRHEGTAVADVVVVQGGEVAFTRCRFTEAVWVEEEDENGRAGLHLLGDTTGIVQDCEVVENEFGGILIGDRSRPTLEGNVCTNNKRGGIVYSGYAGGVARQNDCSHNEWHGIAVEERAQPTLEENVCTDNEQSGIRYAGSAGGVARLNEFSRNGLSGIIVTDEAQPTLEQNVCNKNGEYGIIYYSWYSGAFYLGNPGGVARQNECSNNKLSGIIITGPSQPTLEGNVCSGNEQVGIYYYDLSGGVARQNECSGNGWSGIIVRDRAQPTLEGNICTNNMEGGISYLHVAGGVARQNECSGNLVGIYIEENADPELLDNNCYDNGEGGEVLDLRP